VITIDPRRSFWLTGAQTVRGVGTIFSIWKQVLATLKSAGPTLTNSTTSTSLLGTGAGQDARFNLPSNLLELGTRLSIMCAGLLSTAASSPGTLAFVLQIGPVAVYAPAASPTLASSLLSAGWQMQMELTMLSVGGSTDATFTGSGRFGIGSYQAGSYVFVPAVGAGFDNTASGFIDLFAAFSVASPSNSITLEDYELTMGN
jgi:hypothetical protein